MSVFISPWHQVNIMNSSKIVKRSLLSCYIINHKTVKLYIVCLKKKIRENGQKYDKTEENVLEWAK